MIAQLNGQIGLAYAFVEREIALSKRYWAWELVWLVYGIVTSLSVAYIGLAAPAISGGVVEPAAVSHFVLYLLVGTIAWRFLRIIFENIGEVIAWERWEGTIEEPFVWPALVVGVVSVPLGLRLFVAVERYAKRTGRLKRSG